MHKSKKQKTAAVKQATLFGDTHADDSQKRRSLDELREQRRALLKSVTRANRDLMQHDPEGKADSSLGSEEQLGHLRSLQRQRDQLDKEINEEIKGLKVAEHERKAKKRGQEEKKKSGLVRSRHPNRDFFLADMFDYALKDDGASMEAPIFTLSTRPDVSIWEWRSKDGSRHVKVAPSVLGRATQHDKDVLIYVVSQLTEALNRKREDASNRTVRFTVYDFLVTTNRQTSGRGYKLLHDAFERLAGTRISTDIRTGGTRVREGFGIIDRWKIIEKSPSDERMVAVEVTLSEWLYNAVQAFEVLTIHPNYFRLRKPLARRIYELARKHCGRQAQWSIGLKLLQNKTGSKSTAKEFRRALRKIEEEDDLPEYHFVLGDDDKVTFYSRDLKKLTSSAVKKQTRG